MTLTLRDTLSGALHELPADRPVSLYVCGVTPYDTSHLGHAFTFVQFDTMVRVLRWLGRPVVFIQNVTDVDDSILRRAIDVGVDWRQLGEEEMARHQLDMTSLNVQRPTELVRATDALGEIEAMIGALLDRGAAYAVEGNVFFRIGSAAAFGELSKLDREEMVAIASEQDDADVDDPRKEDALDVAVWKAWSGDEREPRWDSRWGPGRPGWTIECAAISHRFLGPQLDLHGGGTDLVFPHHETEIALVEAATGIRPFVRTWVHTGMVRQAGEKLSKSLGNLIFVPELLEQFGADAVRLYLLSRHYREDWEYAEDDLRAAVGRSERIRARLDRPDRDDGGVEEFRSALEDDLDVPRALVALERTAGPTSRRLAGVLGLHPEMAP